MKFKKTLLATLLLAFSALTPTKVLAVNELTPVYMFGFVSSFNDSIVYFTDIQLVDSAWIDSKTKFLYSRENFAYQLKNYMETNGEDEPTCTIFFSDKRKKIEKRFLKLRKRYTTKGNYIVKFIEGNAFKFENIILDSPEAKYTKAELKEAIKKEKAELKAARKAAKTKAKKDKREKKENKRKAMEDAKRRAKELKKN
ncbi:MAG: hypothetical protein K6C10_00735 [Prevotella sp.]|nr:hypothetical protein [Prevotella sp.]